MPKKVLFATPDLELVKAIKAYFAKSTIEFKYVTDAARVLKIGQEFNWDLIVLDSCDSKHKNIHTCEALRRLNVDKPILMLLPNTHEYIVVQALNAGADFYLFKPLRMQLLRSQVLAVLKRSPKTVDEMLHVKNFSINKSQQMILRDQQELYLGGREFSILLMLAENRGKIVHRERINSATAPSWSDPGLKSIDVHIHNLRKKLGEFGCDINIDTVRGKGYRLPS